MLKKNMDPFEEGTTTEEPKPRQEDQTRPVKIQQPKQPPKIRHGLPNRKGKW